MINTMHQLAPIQRINYISNQQHCSVSHGHKLLAYVRGLVTHSPKQLLFVYSCLEKKGFRAISLCSTSAQVSHVPYFVVIFASLWEPVAQFVWHDKDNTQKMDSGDPLVNYNNLWKFKLASFPTRVCRLLSATGTYQLTSFEGHFDLHINTKGQTAKLPHEIIHQNTISYIWSVTKTKSVKVCIYMYEQFKQHL